MNETTQSGPLFTEDQLNLASDNYEAQEALVDGLRRAYSMSGMSHEDLASELELSVTEAEAWIGGDVDLHLSQLRHLANAIDAKVTYRVAGLRNTYKHQLHAIEATDLLAENGWWRKNDAHVSASDILARRR